jgi:hydrogenase maturation factor
LTEYCSGLRIDVMDFKTLPIKDKQLFLRYAIPCGEVIVRRGELRSDLLRELKESVEQGEEIDAPVGEIFKVAARMCTILAKRMGKPEIDDEVIRRYFMLEHEKAIRWRKLVKPDIDVKDCMVYPGKVLKIDFDKALVQTPLGEAMLKRDFSPDLRKGDWVSTHYDFIAEKIKSGHARKMLKEKSNE